MHLVILLLISIVFIIISTTKFNLHPFLALISSALVFGLLSGMPPIEVAKYINEGFGATVGYIGIVIIAGTIIGAFLEKSGGAFTMAESTLKFIGYKRVPLAMAIIGSIVSIPVFCDSGFVILSPLNKAITKKAKLSLASSAIALSLGLYVTHTMVPPTPGPIAAAGILNADLGQVILWGLLVSTIALIAGWIFATRFAARIYIDPSPELSELEISAKIKEAPSATKAFIPILIPILLIISKSISDFPTNPLGTGLIKDSVSFIGEPIIALLIGVLLAFKLPRKFDRKMLSNSGWVGEALINSAVIIIITGAGGAFGKVLQNSGMADEIGNILSNINLGIWLPFIIAASIKTAQGSSTVSIITTASIMSPLMESLGFDSSVAKSLVVVAIGAGSMVVSHANDSYFWVVTQFSGMDVKTGYKLQTLGTFIIGISSIISIWIISLFLF